MLESPKVNIKIKLAAFWASVTFCYLYGDYFELYTPDKVNSLISGDTIYQLNRIRCRLFAEPLGFIANLNTIII